jgi:hypothetical protein
LFRFGASFRKKPAGARWLDDPTPAHYDITVIEYGGLTGGDGALRVVEGLQSRRVAGFLTSWRNHTGAGLAATLVGQQRAG